MPSNIDIFSEKNTMQKIEIDQKFVGQIGCKIVKFRDPDFPLNVNSMGVTLHSFPFLIFICTADQKLPLRPFFSYKIQFFRAFENTLQIQTAKTFYKM